MKTKTLCTSEALAIVHNYIKPQYGYNSIKFKQANSLIQKIYKKDKTITDDMPTNLKKKEVIEIIQDINNLLKLDAISMSNKKELKKIKKACLIAKKRFQ